jgi:hypothetical protein
MMIGILRRKRKLKLPLRKRGILELSNEDTKKALKSIEENGIKTYDLKELSSRGIALPIDEPCYPIQVHSVSPTQSDGNISLPTEITSTDNFNEFASVGVRCK